MHPEYRKTAKKVSHSTVFIIEKKAKIRINNTLCSYKTASKCLKKRVNKPYLHRNVLMNNVKETILVVGVGAAGRLAYRSRKIKYHSISLYHSYSLYTISQTVPPPSLQLIFSRIFATTGMQIYNPPPQTAVSQKSTIKITAFQKHTRAVYCISEFTY